jgi:serine/threonine protein kinase
MLFCIILINNSCILNSSYICTELCSSTLGGYVSGDYNGPPICSKYQILSQIGLGLEHLHSLGIVHGNLKPSNILISIPMGTVGPAIRLTDFGLRFLAKAENNSYVVPNQSAELRAACIETGGWVTPDHKLTSASDIFPFGCLMSFVLMDGFHPFGADIVERVPRIVKREPMVLTVQQLENVINHSHFAAQIHSLIHSMVNPEANERPPVTQVLATPFLKSGIVMAPSMESVQTTFTSSNQPGNLFSDTITFVFKYSYIFFHQKLNQT